MTFIHGEKKEVRIEVLSTKDEPFTIRNAAYELVSIGGAIEVGGVALVEEHEIYALIEPVSKGSYKLTFTYEIAEERLKTAVSLMVT